MAICEENNKNFLNWWFKLYRYQDKFARKLEYKKLKKLRNLTGKPDISFSIEKCGFSEDLCFFAESLPEDAYIIGELLTLGDSFDDEGVPNSSENISQGTVTEISSVIPSQELDNETVMRNACVLTDDRFTGKFVSPNVVNLSSKHLSETEINLLSKVLILFPRHERFIFQNSK